MRTNEEHISGRVAPIVKEAEAPPAVCGDEEEKHDDDEDEEEEDADDDGRMEVEIIKIKVKDRFV